MPAPPVHPVVYDFGARVDTSGVETSGLQTPNVAAPGGADRAASRSPVVLAEVQSAGTAETSTALHYRLAYDDAQQLRAYQRARWSQPPASLVRERVASALAQQRPVLDSRSAREAVRGGGAMLVLRLEIEEFSQIFSSAAHSSGVLRLRATLAETSAQGERLRGQRVFVAQSPAASQDAAGGSAALARAAQQAARELADWIGQSAR